MPIRLLIFAFAVWLLFTVFVTVFAASANRNEVRNLPKWLWLILCLFVPIVGGLLYLTLGKPIGGPRRPYGRTKVVAPDDDPEFLRDLADKLKQEDQLEATEENKSEKSEEDPDSEKP
jgi:hypothetical protein